MGPLLGASLPVVATPEAAEAPTPSSGPTRTGTQALLSKQAEAGGATPLFAAVAVSLSRSTATRRLGLKRVQRRATARASARLVPVLRCKSTKERATTTSGAVTGARVSSATFVERTVSLAFASTGTGSAFVTAAQLPTTERRTA